MLLPLHEALQRHPVVRGDDLEERREGRRRLRRDLVQEVAAELVRLEGPSGAHDLVVHVQLLGAVERRVAEALGHRNVALDHKRVAPGRVHHGLYLLRDVELAPPATGAAAEAVARFSNGEARLERRDLDHQRTR